jgi:hypothetical protein
VEVSTKKVLKAVPELNKTPSDFSVAMTNWKKTVYFINWTGILGTTIMVLNWLVI